MDFVPEILSGFDKYILKCLNIEKNKMNTFSGELCIGKIESGVRTENGKIEQYSYHARFGHSVLNILRGKITRGP